jgi:hypothetical protein
LGWGSKKIWAIMGEKLNLEKELIELQNKLYALHVVKDEVWAYHPANPDFVNPIRLYEDLRIDIADVERKINDLEFKINSLN